MRLIKFCALLLLAGSVFAEKVAIPLGPLPRDVVPTAYALDLRMDARADRFSGEVRIDLDVKHATSVFFLHARGSVIQSAQIVRAGRAQKVDAQIVEPAGGVLKISSDKPLELGAAQLQIRFDAPYDLRLQGAYKVKSGGLDYVMTQMEALGARNAFPCFDEPAFKTPWTATITAPQGDTAIFNTLETGRSTGKDGWVTHRYATTKPLSSYLIAYAVGPWELVEHAPIGKTALRAEPIPLRGVAAKGQSARMHYMLGETAKIVTALEEYFDYAYPYDKIDLLAAPDFAYGAMENPGLITYRESLMFVDGKSSTSQRGGALTTHIHELAHQWFGDVVTMPWWDDIWLNESFASWAEGKIGAALYPELEADMDTLNGGLNAMNSDSLASARRIHNPVLEWTEVNATFDGITYSKGAAVLTMMERFLGADNFRAALRSHMRQFEFKTATSADLANSFAAQSADPQSLRRAFASFTDQPGVPMLQTTLSCKRGQATLDIAQSRFKPIGASFATDATWLVPMCVRVGRGTTSSVECHLLDQARSSITLDGDRCPDYVHPNADGAGYYRFSLDAKAQAALTEAFTTLNPLEQRVVADSLSAAFESGAIDVEQYLDAAPRFAQATQGDVITSPLGDLRWIRDRVATKAQRKRIDAMLRTVWGAKLEALGIDARDGDSDSTKLLRADLIGTLSERGRPEWLMQELAARGRRVIGLGGDRKLNVDAVHRDQLSTVLRVVVDVDGKPAFDLIERHLAASEDAVIRSALMSALGSADDLQLSERALKVALSPDVKPGEMVRMFYGAAGEAKKRAALWAFVQGNYDALFAKMPSVYQGKISSFGAMALCSESGAVELKSYFGDRVKDLEGGPRALAQSEERVRQCAAKVARHKQG